LRSDQCPQTQAQSPSANPILVGRSPFKKLTGMTVRIGGAVITVAIGTGMVGVVAVGGIAVTAGMATTGVAIVIGTVGAMVVGATEVGIIATKE
jgi:hypothetical protein